MTKIRSILYTLATILIIVGALFILQDDAYGIIFLGLGLVLNIFYRAINLDLIKLKNFQWLEIGGFKTGDDVGLADALRG